ncbi:hypothetical protein [Pseudomonas aeruginosa]|uniref:hypothetical protein n=1 Tax=Pseudomonas aeruginosa TaxID=287 RepID=UPI0018660A49|nr:hypothetical protein [Pseudomonas aeruginosa]MBE2961926.1 hypothetical protein [Pseudomonas aeruginosa]MDU0701035.1 hypothetical protein [Pseudomonas aeruginosa]HDU8950432.1 hypothetical protein [Pseudomonas aeruginosa]
MGTALSSRSKIVSAAHSPLAFFVLALLIVESFLMGAGIWFGLEAEWKIAAIGLGVLLFLVVFGVVVWLVVAHPQNLVFSEESHVQFAAMKLFGNESSRLSAADLQAISENKAPEPPVGQLPHKSAED